MRIAVVRTQVPFVHGGAERLSANLVEALRAHGHEATEVSLPFRWWPGRVLVDHAVAARLTDLTAFEGAPIDLMIGLKFPAWLVRHPNPVYWVLHQHRQAYDMWDAGISDLLNDPDGLAVRDFVREEDRATLGTPGASVYTISRNVTARLDRYLGIAAPPLYHPPPNAGRLRAGPHGDFILAPGRINPMKRQALLLEALAAAEGDVRLVIAGPADSAEYLATLRERARALGVADRVEWTGAISDADMIALYETARAVAYAPVDEDYGYVTLEGMLAARPLIVTTDSGGPLEFVRDGTEGWVVAPSAEALGAAMSEAMADRSAAERRGAAAQVRYAEFGISWETVVAALAGRSVGEARPPVPGGEPAGPDLARLKQTLAPAVPQRLPFRRIEDLFAAYDFSTTGGGGPDLGAAAYFGTHWRRYLATLAEIETRVPRRAVDLGVFPPFVFDAMLAASFPGIAMAGVWEGPQPFAQTVCSRQPDVLPDFAMALRPANLERDRLPFEDASFDLALAMEVLEHLAVDPLFFLTETARILEPGGRLVLTTPNVASHRGVAKVLAGRAPYSFGLFVPSGGVYGRHNREYVPDEVRTLAEAAGFRTVSLRTADVYGDDLDPAVARLLDARGDDFALRGETILYVGEKRGDAPAPVLPPGFYHGDPRQLSARLSIVARDSATGRVRLRVENLSSATWMARGADAVTLVCDWTDATGALVHGGGRVPLDAAVAPGGAAEVTLLTDTDGVGAGQGILRVELGSMHAGRFTLAGRCNTVSLPCSAAAYFRIVS